MANKKTKKKKVSIAISRKRAATMRLMKKRLRKSLENKNLAKEAEDGNDEVMPSTSYQEQVEELEMLVECETAVMEDVPQASSANNSGSETEWVACKTEEDAIPCPSPKQDDIVEIEIKPLPLSVPKNLNVNLRSKTKVKREAAELLLKRQSKLLKKKPAKVYCCVYGCGNHTLMKTKIFCLINNEFYRREDWLRAIRRLDLGSRSRHHICTDHFEQQEIEKLRGRRGKLAREAFPSKNLPLIDEDADPFEDNVQRSENINPSEEILPNDDENEIRGLDGDLKLLVKLKSHLDIINKDDRDYPLYLQKQLFKLYFNNQSVYTFLEKIINLPPAEKLIQNSVPVTTNISKQLMMALQIKVENMTEAAKNCSVSVISLDLIQSLAYNIKQDKIIGFHEIDGIQKPKAGTKAMIVMAQGIYENWTQLVGFALTSEESDEDLSSFYFKLLQNLIDIGLNVRTFVPPSLEFMDTVEVTPDEPYFFINDKKVYYTLDAKYLMKMMRNNLMMYDFKFEGLTAKMEHILTFLQYERSKPNGYVPKHETQIFDKDIAAGISSYIKSNKISDSAEGTVKFISTMSSLYDILNVLKHKQNGSCKTSHHSAECEINILMKALRILKSLVLINPEDGKKISSDLTFVKGFQITIQSILLLVGDLKSDGFNHLATKRLRKDALQHFVSQMQRKKKNHEETQTKLFYLTYSKQFYSDLLKPVKKGVKHKDNVEEIINLLATKIERFRNTISDNVPNYKISSSIYKDLKSPEIDSGFYITSFLFSKCVLNHKDCSVFQEQNKLLLIQNRQGAKYRRYMDYICHHDNDILEKLPAVPSDDLFEFVEKMELIFHRVFQYPINKKVLKTIYREMADLKVELPCECFPMDYLKQLFIRMRIYQTIEVNNQMLRLQRKEEFYENITQ